MPRPDAFAPILGATFVKKQHETILTIGDQHFDKFSMTQRLHCSGSYQAARRLSAALEKLGVRTSRGATELKVESLAQIKGVGVTTLYLFLCWQETGGGNARKWYGNRPGFQTVQRQVRKPNGKSRA